MTQHIPSKYRHVLNMFACVQGQLHLELHQWEGMFYEACASNVCRENGVMLPEMLAYIAKQLQIRLFVLQLEGGHVQATGFGDPGTFGWLAHRTNFHQNVVVLQSTVCNCNCVL
jgi:hypothetical protein